jgi:ABC-type branched-subunit amino acid transport system ATPase component
MALVTKKIDVFELMKNGKVLSIGKAENVEEAKQAAKIYMNAR